LIFLSLYEFMYRQFGRHADKTGVCMKKIGLFGCLGLIVALTLLFGLYAVGARNTLVSLEEDANEKWAQVQNVYQRRADLIPNLVNTVKGYATHEKNTLEAVVKARAAATQPSALSTEAPSSPEDMTRFEAAQAGLSSALSRLLVVVEKYPDLKANENFLSLQSQLEGTENRITVERQRYNEAVKTYNVKLRKFPANLIAGLFGFERKTLFQAKPGSEEAPTVQF
jgi:LemA protein